MKILSDYKSAFLGNLAIVIVSISLAIAFGELCIRFFRNELVDSRILRTRMNDNSIKSIVQPSSDPYLYFELTPNLMTRFQNSTVATSSDGYRIQPGSVSSSGLGKFRVAVLGDSTSFGWGVEYEQSYPELFRRQLESQLKRKIELRNFSVPAYNSEQEMRLFIRKIIPYRPNLVILHYDHNDPEPAGAGAGITPGYMSPEYGDNWLHSSLLKLILRRYRIYQDNKRFDTGDEQQQKVDGYIVRGKLYDRHLVALEKIASMAASDRIPVIVVLFHAYVVADSNYKSSEQYSVLHLQLQKRLEQMGFWVMDLYPYYQEILSQRRWSDMSALWLSREPLDGHPNPAGHQLIARALSDYMQKKPAVLLEFKQSGSGND